VQEDTLLEVRSLLQPKFFFLSQHTHSKGNCPCVAFEKEKKRTKGGSIPKFCKHLQALCLMVGPYFVQLFGEDFSDFATDEEEEEEEEAGEEVEPASVALAAGRKRSMSAPNRNSLKAKVLLGMDGEDKSQIDLQDVERYCELEQGASKVVSDLQKQNFLDAQMRLTEEGRTAINILVKRAEDIVKTSAKKAKKEYMPQFRSGPFTVLLVLASKPIGTKLTKEAIIEAGKSLCRSNLEQTKDGGYAAWGANTLIVRLQVFFLWNKFVCFLNFSVFVGKGSA
jgi:hypothetical protein